MQHRGIFCGFGVQLAEICFLFDDDLRVTLREVEPTSGKLRTHSDTKVDQESWVLGQQHVEQAFRDL